jgi:hypothetical protein
LGVCVKERGHSCPPLLPGIHQAARFALPEGPGVARAVQPEQGGWVACNKPAYDPIGPLKVANSSTNSEDRGYCLNFGQS